MMYSPECHDSRPCFAKRESMGGVIRCRILSEVYKADGECKFCKPKRETTNGVHYPNMYTDPESEHFKVVK